MASLGPRDTRDFTVFTGVDATELAKLSLQDGTTAQAVVSLLEAGYGALNVELNNDPLYSSLWSFTNDPQVSYRVGTNMTFGDRTEYARPDPQRAAMEGHMLPLKGYDMALGWTWDYLRDAYMGQIEADIASSINAARDKVRAVTLTKLITKTDATGSANGLGAAGISPGFATTAASTGVDFLPPSYAGTAFATTHEHYAIGATTLTAAQFVTNMKNLREHGHKAPFTLLISPTDSATVSALTTFVAISDPRIAQYSSTTAIVNSATAPENAIGYLTDSQAWVVPVDGWPANYTFMFKSYGPNSPLNPLRVRVRRGETSLRVIAFPDPNKGTSPANPLGTLIGFTEFGVGVNDRTDGVPHYSNSSWADGTVS